MNLEKDKYFHLYNRTNNKELLFRNEENYIYFLKKYRHYFDTEFDTISYCLMPTHFHFLIKVTGFDTDNIKRKIGIFLRSYTNAFNKKFERTGSLFQQKTKTKLIDKDDYFKTLVIYIHQNPLRSGLVVKQEDWKFSSFNDFVGFRNGLLPKYDIILKEFKNSSKKEFYKYSQEMVKGKVVSRLSEIVS